MEPRERFDWKDEVVQDSISCDKCKTFWQIYRNQKAVPLFLSEMKKHYYNIVSNVSRQETVLNVKIKYTEFSHCMPRLIALQGYILIYFSKLSITSIKLQYNIYGLLSQLNQNNLAKQHAVLACALQVFSLF